jgi:hypothetical protein
LLYLVADKNLKNVSMKSWKNQNERERLIYGIDDSRTVC